MSLEYPIQNDDWEDFISNFYKSEPTRYFGNLDRLFFSKNREEEIFFRLRSILDKDTYYLLESKLFSKVITKDMAQYSKDLEECYNFQQDFLNIFKKFYMKAREKGIDPHEAEVRSAKIIWNFIETGRFEQTTRVLLKDRDPRLTPERDNQLLTYLKISSNLVKIVEGNYRISEPSSSAYQTINKIVSQAISLFRNSEFKEAIFHFETALHKLQEVEKETISLKFALLVGTVLSLYSETISKGIYFLKRAEKTARSIDDKVLMAECMSELSHASWTQGLFRETLDYLSIMIDIHAKQKNNLAVMLSEEKLSHFFQNLSRYQEAQEWGLRFLNSSIRTSDHKMKAIFFLESNKNFAEILIGLNSWEKAEKYLQISEKTIENVKFSEDYFCQILLDIHRMRGHIEISRGNFGNAKQLFLIRNDINPEVLFRSPAYNEFLRTEATFYRNQGEFSKAIATLQPLFQQKDQINPLNVAYLAELLALHNHETEALKILKRSLEVLTKWNSVHGLARTYLALGYTYLLLEEFDESAKWYHKSLELGKNELMDLRIAIDANLQLGYMSIEKDNFKHAERYIQAAEQYAMMSGSKASILDTYLIKAAYMIETGEDIAGINALRRIATEAQDSEIGYIYRKTKFRLDQF
ncbi:MAG: tetratricopeptide repeat protein [Candidatus Heimdallarchaeota archaeon]|nr:tetratricopeptide repeat protein [Candidatus Heimdallarchaeota archaeon]